MITFDYEGRDTKLYKTGKLVIKRGCIIVQLSHYVSVPFSNTKIHNRIWRSAFTPRHGCDLNWVPRGVSRRVPRGVSRGLSRGLSRGISDRPRTIGSRT